MSSPRTQYDNHDSLAAEQLCASGSASDEAGDNEESDLSTTTASTTSSPKQMEVHPQPHPQPPRRSGQHDDFSNKEATHEDLVDADILELLVIGAGPHALSLLTRLADDDPDLLTECERGWVMQSARRYRPRPEVRAQHKKRFDLEEKVKAAASTSSGGLHLLEKNITPRRRAAPDAVKVIDGHGSWLAQWKRDFAAFDIKWLRSHEHLHCDPFDFQGLSVWTETQKRYDELKEMLFVDRDSCRKVGYSGPFVTPSNALFLDFCAHLVDRYNLKGLVEKGFVTDVRIVRGSSKANATAKLFEVVLADGRKFLARRVVCALGPGPAFQGMRATLPWWAEDLQKALNAAAADEDECRRLLQGEDDGLGSLDDHLHGGTTSSIICGEPIVPSRACRSVVFPAPPDRLLHSSHLSDWLRDGNNFHALRGKKVLVVGGGQTSAHLAQVALKRGALRVCLCCRRPITRKPYDVDVAYVGNRRPHFLDKFQNIADFRKRKEFNANLRAGGSMSAEVYAEVLALMQDNYDPKLCGLNGTMRKEWENGRWANARPGGSSTTARRRTGNAKPDANSRTTRAGVLEGTSKVKALAASTGTRTSNTNGRSRFSTFELFEGNEVSQAHWCAASESLKIRFEDGELRDFDFIFLATGGNFDMQLVPVFASLQKQSPIACVDGLPCLQPDLKWAPDVDLYVMGAFAQLQLGADALNLAGARSGGVLVARALRKELFGGRRAAGLEEEEEEDGGAAAAAAAGGVDVRAVENSCGPQAVEAATFASKSEEKLNLRKRGKGTSSRGSKKKNAGRTAPAAAAGTGDEGASLVNEAGEWLGEACDCCH